MNEKVNKLKIEFSGLFQEATRTCYSQALRVCQKPLPNKYLYYFPGDDRYDFDDEKNVKLIPSTTLNSFDGAISLLFRDDGSYRSEIHLYPEGVTDEATVFKVLVAANGNTWTNHPLTRGFLASLLASPFPFVICGPNLPLSWIYQSPNLFQKRPFRDRIKLPRIQVLPEDFDWNLSLASCSLLQTTNPAVRKITVEQLMVKLAHGFKADHILNEILALGRKEQNIDVQLALLHLFRYISHPECVDILRMWATNPNSEVRRETYHRLANYPTNETFTFLLANLSTEIDEDNQRLLLVVIEEMICQSPQRIYDVRQVVGQIDLFPSAQKVFELTDQRFR